jgi:tripartite-type tricarboxylate transporter receptor subunit TctC
MNRAVHATLFALVSAFAGAALAQPYPSKPVRMVVPWPPGGVSDVLARAVAQQMAEPLGQQVVVENRPGAGGTIGVAAVAKSAPDGYTLVMTDVPSHAISASLYSKLPYDPARDLEPIAMAAGSPMVLATHPGMNAKSLAEFLQVLRASPGKYSYASSGNGSVTHLAIERLKLMARIDAAHIPFKGTVPAIQSVLAGDTVMAFGTIPGVAPHAKAGRLVLLGVSFPRRFSQLPEVAPIGEQVAGFDMGFYTALFAPAKTPKEIIDRLHAATTKALAHPKTREIYAASAAEPGTMSSAELQAYVAREIKDWAEVVRATGLKID